MNTSEEVQLQPANRVHPRGSGRRRDEQSCSGRRSARPTGWARTGRAPCPTRSPVTSPDATPAAAARRRAVSGFTLYDVANSAFVTTVVTAVGGTVPHRGRRGGGPRRRAGRPARARAAGRVAVRLRGQPLGRPAGPAPAAARRAVRPAGGQAAGARREHRGRLGRDGPAGAGPDGLAAARPARLRRRQRGVRRGDPGLQRLPGGRGRAGRPGPRLGAGLRVRLRRRRSGPRAVARAPHAGRSAGHR